jgi:uridine phosphorylase
VTLASLVGGHGYAEAVVALAWRRCVRLLLGVGLCGGLAGDLDVGDLAVPCDVIREDGLTDHYVEPGYPAAAHPILVARLLEYLGPRGWRPRPVIAVSRSSTFTESPDWVKRMASLRVACVDVETSTLYTLSALTGIPAAAALIVSDSLVKERCELETGSLRDSQVRLILDMVEFAGKTGIG